MRLSLRSNFSPCLSIACKLQGAENMLTSRRRSAELHGRVFGVWGCLV